MIIPPHCISFHCPLNYKIMDFITPSTKVCILYITSTLCVLYALPRIQKIVLVWEEEEIPWFVHPRIALVRLTYKIV